MTARVHTHTILQNSSTQTHKYVHLNHSNFIFTSEYVLWINHHCIFINVIYDHIIFKFISLCVRHPLYTQLINKRRSKIKVSSDLAASWFLTKITNTLIRMREVNIHNIFIFLSIFLSFFLIFYTLKDIETNFHTHCNKWN